MKFFSGHANSLPSRDLSDLLAYRYALFVKSLGWDLPMAIEEKECDQFDRPDTIYIGARDETDSICGCARLLPTSSPYLLGDVFPELLGGASCPKSNEIWEISRFAASDLKRKGALTLQQRQFETWLSREILANCVAVAMEHGAKKLISVSPIGIERLLTRMGVTFRRAAPAVRLGDHHLFACWIDLDDKTLSALDVCKIFSAA